MAPEATYQAWFAHFLMEQFDPRRVVRAVDFGSRYLEDDDRHRFSGTCPLAAYAELTVLRAFHEP